MHHRGKAVAGFMSTLVLVASMALFVWIAAGGAQDEAEQEQSPPPGSASGPRPESPTPTLPPPVDETAEAAKARLRAARAGNVFDRAAARDVEALLELVAFDQHLCDDPRAYGVYEGGVTKEVCSRHGVAAGTFLPLFHLEGDDTLVDRETLAAFLGAVFASEPSLVFAASVGNRVGMSFASSPREQLGLGEVAGVWFNVNPSDGRISTIYFYGRHSGPKEIFQTFYQSQGGELWFHDAERAPGGEVATPDAPPARP